MGQDNYSISSIKGQVGVQWNAILNAKRILTFGATYDFGGDLNPEVTKKLYIGDLYNTVVKGRYDAPEAGAAPAAGRGGLLPDRQVGRRRGLCVPELGRPQLGLRDDGNQRQRGEQDGIQGGLHQYEHDQDGCGIHPNRYDARHFLKRWSYRAGFRYGAYNQTFNGDKLAQYAVTAGIGIPVRRGAFSAIDIGVEYGRRGYNIADRLGLVRQQYFKFAIGFTLFAGQMENGEYWFMRSKFD